MTNVKSIKEWFEKKYLGSDNFKSTSIDIDYFLDRDSDPLCFVKKGIEMLNELISLCEKHKALNAIMPCLEFPLKSSNSNKLILFNSNTFVLENELHDLSPGDLCLVKRNEAEYCPIAEQYEREIKIAWPTVLNKNCKTFYKCYRDAAGVQNNWEFDRVICIMHYTDHLLEFYKD